GQRIGDPHLLDPLLDRPVQSHRAGDTEFAAVGARAADHVGDLAGAGLAEAELEEPLPDVEERLVANPTQDEVLLHGAAGSAAGVLAHDRGEAAELLRAEVAAGDLHLHSREALLALRLDVALEEALELGALAVRRGGRERRRGGVSLLVMV